MPDANPLSQLLAAALPVPLFPQSALLRPSPGATPYPVGAEQEEKKKEDDALPSIEEVTAAMKKTGACFRRDASLFGGYPRGWTADRAKGKSENRESPTLIEIQPPGTPVVGLAWIDAWHVTADPLYLQAARETAQALMWCQLASGGWPAEFDFHPESAGKYHLRRDLFAGDTDSADRRNRSSLDDNKTQSAFHFLLELAFLEPCRDDVALREALEFGMTTLLAAQAPNGGWPQMYSGPADPALPADLKASFDENWPRTFPAVDYGGFYTLNDGNVYHLVRLLARAHELTGENRYLDAIRRTGEFLLAAQLPEPHPAWAQQYDQAMRPAWARKFEPPAVVSVESKSVLDTLREIWLITGEERWLAPFESCLKWLRSVRLPDGRWSRLYELGSNRPLYLVAETYEVTYDDSNLPTHYGFKIGADFADGLDQLEEEIAGGREELLRRRQPLTQEKSWAKKARSLRHETRAALDGVDEHGRWLNAEGELDSHLFRIRFSALTRYLEAARNGGATFEKLWKESQPPPPAPGAVELETTAKPSAQEAK